MKSVACIYLCNSLLYLQGHLYFNVISETRMVIYKTRRIKNFFEKVTTCHSCGINNYTSANRRKVKFASLVAQLAKLSFKEILKVAYIQS